jgi:septal ring-binding cell division protein DamX
MAAGVIVALLLAVWLGSMIPGWINQGVDQTAIWQPQNSRQAEPGSTYAGVTHVPAVKTDQEFELVSKAVAVQDNDFNRAEKPSLLDQRLSETEKWLAAVDDDHYSIQLFMTRIADAKALERFLNEPSDLLDFEKIYVYETKIGGSRMYSVLYNDFDTRKSARSILQNLPADMRASKPFLRRVSALRKDLESSG